MKNEKNYYKFDKNTQQNTNWWKKLDFNLALQFRQLPFEISSSFSLLELFEKSTCHEESFRTTFQRSIYRLEFTLINLSKAKNQEKRRTISTGQITKPWTWNNKRINHFEFDRFGFNILFTDNSRSE